MEINKWPFGWERDYTEGQLKEMLNKLGLEFVTSYGWGFGPVLGLGLKSRLHKILNISTSNDERQKNRTMFQKSWFARHCLNFIGVVGRKP